LVVRLKSNILSIIRLLLSQSKRNRSLDILQLLKCTNCGGTDFFASEKGTRVTCSRCGCSHKAYIPSFERDLN